VGVEWVGKENEKKKSYTILKYHIYHIYISYIVFELRKKISKPMCGEANAHDAQIRLAS